MKFVIVMLAVVLLVWLVTASSRRRGSATRRAKPAAPAQVEGMVACAHCGVHLPGSLAVHGGGQPFCSAAHRDAGARAP